VARLEGAALARIVYDIQFLLNPSMNVAPHECSWIHAKNKAVVVGFTKRVKGDVEAVKEVCQKDPNCRQFDYNKALRVGDISYADYLTTTLHDKFPGDPYDNYQCRYMYDNYQ